MRIKPTATLFQAVLLLVGLLSTPALADEEGLYLPGDFRIARPGARPVSNFYPVAGFRPVDPSCFSGVVTMEVESSIPAVAGGAKFYVYERINLRPVSRGQRFPYRYRWEVSSDPFTIGPVTSVSDGGGGGTARAWLTVDMAHSTYRLVTDTRPRMGDYTITTTGPGISRAVGEDFFFYFADHHYSYVDLSQLEANAGHPEVAAALGDIRTMLSQRPPNVFMGTFVWIREVDGRASGDLRLDHEEHMALNWAGFAASGTRTTSIRVWCPALLRQFLRE